MELSASELRLLSPPPEAAEQQQHCSKLWRCGHMTRVLACTGLWSCDYV